MAKSKAKIKKLRENRTPKNKIKTKRAAAKRYKVLGSGKVKFYSAGKRHGTGLKDRSRKNHLRKNGILGAESMLLVKRCMPNSF